MSTDFRKDYMNSIANDLLGFFDDLAKVMIDAINSGDPKKYLMDRKIGPDIFGYRAMLNMAVICPRFCCHSWTTDKTSDSFKYANVLFPGRYDSALIYEHYFKDLFWELKRLTE
jgi:hypothetical protein